MILDTIDEQWKAECVWPFQSHSCYTPSNDDSISLSREFTGEEVLGSKVADAQAEDGEFVQSGRDLLGERQQAGQTLQLPVQPVSMPFGRVGLGPFSRRLLHPDEHHTRRKSQQTNRFKIWPLFRFFSFCQFLSLCLGRYGGVNRLCDYNNLMSSR